MKNKWIKKGDKVLVIAGNDRGVVGEVMARTKDRILVQGVNVRKRHMKSREQNRKSEIIEIERSIHISNVTLCDSNQKKLKINMKQGPGNKRELVYLEGAEEKSHRILRKETSKDKGQ
ncbi:MAG: 50S ribosomal protein L24 [Chlamydiota bacterium]